MNLNPIRLLRSAARSAYFDIQEDPRADPARDRLKDLPNHPGVTVTIRNADD